MCDIIIRHCQNRELRDGAISASTWLRPNMMQSQRELMDSYGEPRKKAIEILYAFHPLRTIHSTFLMVLKLKSILLEIMRMLGIRDLVVISRSGISQSGAYCSL